MYEEILCRARTIWPVVGHPSPTMSATVAAECIGYFFRIMSNTFSFGSCFVQKNQS